MLLVPESSFPIMTIWMEARGEPYEGKVGVAEVIYRRTKRKYFSNGTYAGTCLWAKQFSCWNENDRNRIAACGLDTEDHVVQDCIRAWGEAMSGSNLTKDALHYYSTTMWEPPYWTEKMQETARIGRHVFLKEG